MEANSAVINKCILKAAIFQGDYWQRRAKSFEDYSLWCKNLELFKSCIRPLDDLSISARCLDLGGGSGWVARRDGKLSGRRWTVLDICPDFARYFRQSVRFVVGDAHAIPFRDRMFDYTLIRSVLHYVDSPIVLGEVNRMLPLGGLLVVAQKVATYNKKDHDWFLKFNHLKCPQSRVDFRAAELGNLLFSGGFKITESISYIERRQINVEHWFGKNGPLANPNQDRINSMLRLAPSTVTNSLRLDFSEERLSYDEHWEVLTCRKIRHVNQKPLRCPSPKGSIHRYQS